MLNPKKKDFGWFSLTIHDYWLALFAAKIIKNFHPRIPRIMATCATSQQEPHDASDFVGHREDHPIAQCLGAW